MENGWHWPDDTGFCEISHHCPQCHNQRDEVDLVQHFCCCLFTRVDKKQEYKNRIWILSQLWLDFAPLVRSSFHCQFIKACSASISLFSVENASQPVLKIEAGSNVGEGSFRSELNWFWCNTWHSFEKGTFNTKETFRKNWGYFDLLLMWKNGTFSNQCKCISWLYVWFKNSNIFQGGSKVLPPIPSTGRHKFWQHTSVALQPVYKVNHLLFSGVKSQMYFKQDVKQQHALGAEFMMLKVCQ